MAFIFHNNIDHSGMRLNSQGQMFAQILLDLVSVILQHTVQPPPTDQLIMVLPSQTIYLHVV